MTRIGSGSAGGLSGVSSISLDGLDLNTTDIETLLAAVQLRRADLIEGQLRQQVQDVQGRNNALAALNTLKGSISTQASYFGGDAGKGQLIDQAHYNPSNYDKERLKKAYTENPEQALADAKAGVYGNAGKELAEFAQSLRNNGFDDQTVFKVANGSVTAAELDSVKTTTNAKADNLSSSQQLDMIRLQALQQRRTESFDVVTNTYKKMGDSRASVVSNMR
ncbi:MAG: hypothetical protein ACO3AD_17680 [Burkholderiaceae bacterium]